MTSAPAEPSAAPPRRPPVGVILAVVIVVVACVAGVWFLQTRAADAAETSARAALEQQEIILVANGAHIEVLNAAKPIDDATFAKIADLAHLHTCIFSGSQLTDNQMAVLGRLPNLVTLQVDSNPAVTSQGMMHLAGQSSLEKLFANDTSIDDTGLVHLQGFGRLNTLDLSYTKITDEGLKQLVALSKLEVLRICGTSVTDAGVESLKAMSALKLLNVGNTKITPAGVKALRAARKDLAVEEQEQGGR